MSAHGTARMKDPAAELRAHGLRATPAALAVLEVLHAARAPLTHDEAAREYQRRVGAPPDRVTLYRILDRLAQAGLCDRISGADRRTRFAAHGQGAGYVFECSACHKVLPLPDDPELPAVLDRLGRSLKRRGIRASEATVMLHGTCRDCGKPGR